MQVLSTFKNIKTIAMSVAVILVLFILIEIFYPFNIGDHYDRITEIKEGSNLTEIASMLKAEGIIKNKPIFIVYVTALGEDENLKAGEYNFTSRVSMYQVVNVLTGNFAKHDDIQVTIPEGMNVWEIDEVLTKAGFVMKGEFVNTAIGSEGYLFPDTYRFKRNVSVEEIIDKMIENFDFKTGSVTEPYFKNMGDLESHNIIVIASILEKEAKTEEDMRIVSGIIKNRLEVPAGMLLQIDATVAYGACLREFKSNGRLCDVTQIGLAKEINIDGPYNTYMRMGLPPGPISNPGLKAIQAALNPKETDYLYYLSTRDGSQIIYSKTASEHLQSRRKYLGF